MNIYEKCIQSADYIKSQFDATDAIGIILGSGLGNLADDIAEKQEVSYQDIPNFPMTKVPGHAGKLILGKLNGVKVLCMAGRFHFYEGYDMKTVSMPIRVMKLIGVKTVILTNAAGGINRNFSEGCLMLINDFINFMGDNPLVGENVDELGPRFPDMVNALPQYLKDIALDCAKELGITLHSGTYMSFRGPNFETPAEIRFAATIGADAAGMSTVPEILVARHCGLPCMGISCITNMAAGITGKELSHQEVQEAANKVNKQFKDLIKAIVEKIDQN